MSSSDNPEPDVEAGESTPLVGDKYSPENEPPPLENVKESTMKEKLVAGGAAVTFGTSIGAMLVESNPAVYVSGAMGAAIAPYAAFQQSKITEVQALKETNERLSEEVDQLKFENVRLQSSVQELDKSVQHLQEMNETLDTIRATEGQSIKELEKQLADSQDILDKMSKNLKADILQNLISCVLACDEDGDRTLNDAEIDALIQQMEGLQGVELKEEEIKKGIVENGRSLNAIMTIARSLLNDEGGGFFNFVEGN